MDQAVISIASGTNPTPKGSILRLKLDTKDNLIPYRYGKWEWSGNATGTSQIIDVPTDKVGTFSVSGTLDGTASGAPRISTSYNYTVTETTPNPNPDPSPTPAPTGLTSITISSYDPPTPDPTGKRAYRINENTSGFNPAWYVNDFWRASGPTFNFKGNAGDRIYAILNTSSATADDRRKKGDTLTNVVRSNTIIFNPDGADGAGAGGTSDKDIDGDGIPDAEDDDIDGDGIKNEDDDDIDGDGITNDEDTTPAGNNVTTYDTLYTRASQAQYLGDVFHADPTHTNPPAPEKTEGFNIPTPLLIMVGLAGAFLLYNNRKK